ncbi:hypothetical protein FXF51_01860 [Nonomuraea sp. PA05]|uniref:hypothetical protein n=1 Tax=Nonomuraea sp. PA05 TaxID=2604466 RepID=UPI0011D66A23|nr:hypothetical protein [Nonomuraea sp. PA05]TYB71206.1 hypothetical protein FXF51_01860 [Nonomuraea sp. PA05]
MNTPIYAGPDGTFLDVRAAADDARYGSIVLDVSGQPIPLAPMAALWVIDLLSTPKPGVPSLVIALGDEDDSPLLTFFVEEGGIDVHRTLDGRTTHRVMIPFGHLPVVVACMYRMGTGAR